MFLSVFLYGSLAGIATIIGTLLILYKYEWARHNSIHLMSFAAGVMLAIAFLHLIPEATGIWHNEENHIEGTVNEGEAHDSEMDEHTGEKNLPYIFILLGFAIFYALESIIVNAHPRHDVDGECTHANHSTLSLISITGLTFHSLIDGIIIAIGFKAGHQIGLMTTVAVILHEMPEGVITTSILLHDDMKRNRIVWYSLMVALATPFGAIISYLILGNVSQNVIRLLLALAAGSFIYIAGSDLIPEIHKSEKRLNTVVLLAGIAVLYFIGKLLGHGH